MKVCLVGPDSVHIKRFYGNMKTRDIEFLMVAEEKVDWFEGKQFNISFRGNNGIRLLKNYQAARKYLRKENPQVVHIHQINRLAVIVGKAARKEGIKIIETAWGSDVLLVPKRNKFYAALTRSALQKADIITADAEIMIESMRALHPGGDYRMWQYGIDPIPAVAEKENIIYSNRMHEPLYRIDKIIEYFAAFSKENPDWKLVIAGTGPLSGKLKNQVAQLGLEKTVEFAGYCDAARNADFYARSSIFASIPKSDGTSVSLMEAMSAGCIPVVSDLPVNHDWVSDGSNGIIERPGENPLSKALGINRDEAAEINTRLTDSISRDKMADEMMGFYRELV